MSFVKQVEGFDARHGIPRPAEMQAMPAYQAFLRLMAAGVMMLVLVGCGALSAYLIWLSAGYLEVSTAVKLYFIIAMLACLLVGCMEALQEVLAILPDSTKAHIWYGALGGRKLFEDNRPSVKALRDWRATARIVTSRSVEARATP